MVTYLQSLQQHLADAMQKDPRVYLLGEDILDPYGGAFKVSKGLSTQFPGRVITTPISEAGFVGVANGMALRGLKPVAEIMFGDFITLAADQIINYAAKFNAMYQQEMPGALVLRTPVGAGRGYGPTHSQSLEKILLGIPHLRILAPSHFHNPGKMLESAILHETQPVIFLEHKLLYTTQLFTAQPDSPLSVETDHTAFPTAVVRNYQHGTADLTIIGYGGVSLWVEPLMLKMAAEEIRINACFPGEIQPLDMKPLLAAARESGRVIIIEEGTLSWGWGAEVAARIQNELWGHLKAPVQRIAALDTIVPAAKPLEQAYLPSMAQIENTIYEVIA